MGNGCNHHHHKILQLQLSRSIFLPFLCSKPSIKDVAHSKLEDLSISFSADPLSPKIGCMGQVKRHGEILGFPPPNKIAIATTKIDRKDTIPLCKYSKLTRIFSAKNYPTTTITSMPDPTTDCRRKGAMILNGGRRPKIELDGRQNHHLSVKIEDIDPPLPVIKKIEKPADEKEKLDTIWKRRSGGVALKSLQLQQIQLNRYDVSST